MKTTQTQSDECVSTWLTDEVKKHDASQGHHVLRMKTFLFSGKVYKWAATSKGRDYLGVIWPIIVFLTNCLPALYVVVEYVFDSITNKNGHSVERIPSHITRLGNELWTFWHYLHVNWIQIDRAMVKRFWPFHDLDLWPDWSQNVVKWSPDNNQSSHQISCDSV